MSRVSIGLEQGLNDYLVEHQAPEHPVAAALRARTAKLPMAGMQIAPEQGQLLAFLARAVGTRQALEVGTFTGYSALTIALVLPEDGRLVACDVSEEWTSIGRPYWQEAGVADKIDLRLGPAIDTLAALEKEGAADRFDFAFIDADKTGYGSYYESVLRLVRTGGIIALDNMLQHGRVADRQARGGDVAAIRALNTKIAADERVDRVLVPVGDGMTFVRRRA
jgi:predicted O-methyltransferase YrrM